VIPTNCEMILTLIVVGLLAFVFQKDKQNSKLIDKLTNKIMAGDFGNYATFAKHVDQPVQTEKKKDEDKQSRPARDPHLGGQF